MLVVAFVLNMNDTYRLSAQELLECSFLAVEPDVQLLATDPSHKLLTLQVVFKGSDKVSVKFEFNVVMYHAVRWIGMIMADVFLAIIGKRYSRGSGCGNGKMGYLQIELGIY